MTVHWGWDVWGRGIFCAVLIVLFCFVKDIKHGLMTVGLWPKPPYAVLVGELPPEPGKPLATPLASLPLREVDSLSVAPGGYKAYVLDNGALKRVDLSSRQVDTVAEKEKSDGFYQVDMRLRESGGTRYAAFVRRIVSYPADAGPGESGKLFFTTPQDQWLRDLAVDSQGKMFALIQSRKGQNYLATISQIDQNGTATPYAGSEYCLTHGLSDDFQPMSIPGRIAVGDNYIYTLDSRGHIYKTDRITRITTEHYSAKYSQIGYVGDLTVQGDTVYLLLSHDTQGSGIVGKLPDSRIFEISPEGTERLLYSPDQLNYVQLNTLEVRDGFLYAATGSAIIKLKIPKAS